MKIERFTDLICHPIYSEINSLEKLRKFMECHVFAVWDFMSLTKRIQIEMTCIKLPWVPVIDSKAARLINEIVLSEETDKNIHGEPHSHLEMYLQAMRDIGARTEQFQHFLMLVRNKQDYVSALKQVNASSYIIDFVTNTIEVAHKAPLLDVVAYFLYGRENIIPGMFKALLSHWAIDTADVPNLVYYLERHIELDGNEHSVAGKAILKNLIHQDEGKKKQALLRANEAIESRIKFWDEILVDLMSSSHKKENMAVA